MKVKKPRIEIIIIILSIIVVSILAFKIYDFCHIDVTVIRYINENDKGFEEIDLQKNTTISIGFLGTYPALVDHIGMNISEKILNSMQTNISIKKSKNENSLPFIKIMECHIELKNESGKIIPFKSIEFGNFSKHNTFLTEEDFINRQFIKKNTKDHRIYYLYEGDLKELQNATIEIDLTLSLDGEIVKIHRKEKLRRTERIDTKWGPFI